MGQAVTQKCVQLVHRKHGAVPLEHLGRAWGSFRAASWVWETLKPYPTQEPGCDPVISGMTVTHQIKMTRFGGQPHQ